MAFKISLIFCILIIGNLAIPRPVLEDYSLFFQHADPESRIVGGTAAAAGSNPHMVALTTGVIVRSLFCGGSIITPRTVLTAAHCIDGVFYFGSLSSSLRVTVGTNHWIQGGDTYTVSGNTTHHHYVARTIKNDIGILYTSSAIVYNDLVRPVPVSYSYIDEAVTVKAAGWGRIFAGGPFSGHLLELTLATISGDHCVRDVAQAAVDFNMISPPVEPHLELCVIHSVGYGMCNGDSGSALVRVDSGAQVGIVSWGFPCARGAPDMFVRISAFESWIQYHTKH